MSQITSRQNLPCKARLAQLGWLPLLALSACVSPKPTATNPSPALHPKHSVTQASSASAPIEDAVANPVAKPKSPTTFLGILEVLRERSPLLAAARARSAADLAAVDGRRAARLGQITPFAQITQYNSNRLVGPITSFSKVSSKSFDDQIYIAGLAGQLDLDVNGRLDSGVRGAEARALASDKQVEALWLRLSDRASSLYRGLQALQGTRSALEIQRDALAHHLVVAQKSVDLGRLEPVEVLRIKAARDAVQGQLAQLDANEASLRSGLAALLHQQSFVAPVQAPEAAPVFPAHLSDDLSSRPDIRASAYAVESAAHSARAADADRGLDLALIGGIQVNGSFDANDSTFANVGLRLSWPAYDGGRRSSKQRTARHAEHAARMELEGVEDSAHAELVASSAAWQAAKSALQSAQSGHSAAAEAARVQRERYKADRLSATDLLDAEARLAEASHGLSQALVNCWRADDSLFIAHGLLPRGEASSQKVQS